MLQLTERDVVIIVVGGTAAMLMLCITIIAMVVFMHGKRREWEQENEELRAKLKKQTPAPPQSEFIQISNGRTIKRRTS